jgi:hypothetical protein
MFLCDFHIHSHNSDGRLSIPELVDYYGQRGFAAIAITDHLCETKTFLGQSAQYLQKTLLQSQFERYIHEILIEAHRARHRYNMLVIPGVEFTKNSFSRSDSAHIVGLGLRQWIDPNGDVEQIIEGIHQQGGLAIAAHPVSTRKIEPQTYHLWYNRDRLREKIDAWEVASGAHLFDEVYESGLPMVASSDLHHPRQMSSWKTLISGPRTERNVFAAIKNQDLNFTYYENPHPWMSSREERVLTVTRPSLSLRQA